MRATTISCSTLLLYFMYYCATCVHFFERRPTQSLSLSLSLSIYIYFTVIVCYSNIRNRLLTMLLLYIFTPPAHQHQHSKLCRTNKLSTSTHASRSRDKASARPTCPVTCGQERPAPAPRRWLGVTVGHGRARQELAFLGNGLRFAHAESLRTKWDPRDDGSPSASGPDHEAPRCMRCRSRKETLTLGMLQK